MRKLCDKSIWKTNYFLIDMRSLFNQTSALNYEITLYIWENPHHFHLHVPSFTKLEVVEMPVFSRNILYYHALLQLKTQVKTKILWPGKQIKRRHVHCATTNVWCVTLPFFILIPMSRHSDCMYCLYLRKLSMF